MGRLRGSAELKRQAKPRSGGTFVAYTDRKVCLTALLGRKRRNLNRLENRAMDIVTILIIVILVLLAIYLFQRVF
jgi:hypothetical protein